MQALKLDDVYYCFANKPLEIDELETYYVNTDKARGLIPMEKMKRILERNPGGSYKFLFAGYKGCGKSTELNRLQKELNQDFIILNFSVLKELDILNINYIELFIALMKRLFDFVKEEKKIKIPREYIQNITNWAQSKEIEEISNKYLGVNIKTRAQA
jgi:SpoVK/Ycf46/Vps4 family AAA+-type ATPase